MTRTVNAQVKADAGLLLDYMDSQGLDGAVQVNRGQAHMGGLIVDSALQRRQRYASVVAPRVQKLIAAWPDADTTSQFRTRLGAQDDGTTNDWAAGAEAVTSNQTGLGELGTVINWHSQERLVQIARTADVFHGNGIDTTADLRSQLEDQTTRQALRRILKKIPNIGPKTLDYFDILCGITEASAIDSRIRLATGRAGIAQKDYEHLKQVMAHAAGLRDWRVGDLDAVLWASHAS
jgi:hypothetical protein